MPRGRPPKNEPSRKLTVQIPKSLADLLDVWAYEPARSQPRYGAKSGLIEMLLREFFKKPERTEQ